MSKRRGSRATAGSRPGRQRLLVEQLEPRILLSADLPLLALPGDAGSGAFERPLGEEAQGDTTELHESRHELVFVDAGVEDHADLLADLRARRDDGARFDVYLLDSERDGFSQISAVLAGYEGDLDAVHVLSHGTDAGVQLGSTWLTGGSLAERAGDVLGWRDALTKEADFLFYGCDLAASEDGRALVDQLAVLTGADVAASVDETGAAALGGDWELEYAAGSIETQIALSDGMRLRMSQVLGGTAIWAENGSNTPEAADFDGAAFGPEFATAGVGGEFRVFTGVSSATRDEMIVTGINDSGFLSTIRWDGTSWTNDGTWPSPMSDPEKWGLDLAYESQSGDAILTFNDGLGGIGYTVWNGSSWTPVGSVPRPEPGEASHMKLAASPDSDEVVLVVSNANNDDYAVVWNGSSWGNAITLENGSGGVTSNTEVNVAYEQSSGHAMVVWGENNDQVHYQIWNGSSWQGEQTLAAPGGVSGDPQWTSIASDPNSDRIVIGVGTDANESWFSVWNGSSWETPQQAATDSPHSDRLAVAVAFESQSGRAIAAYAVFGLDEVRYQTWASGGGWSGELVGPTFDSHVDAITLDADPESDQVMLSLIEMDRDVSFTLWDGSSWGTPSTLESDAGTNFAQPFLFLWDQVATSPSISASGAGTVSTGSSYTLNLAATGVDVASLSWTIDWGDGVVQTIAGNPSSVDHTYTNAGFTNNILVSASDVNGTYMAGDLLSTSFQTDSVMRFDATTGEFLQEFGNGDVNSPVDVQIGPDGGIYVTGFNSNNIYRYDADGSFGTEFVSAGSGGLSRPSRIAFGPDGNLYVTSMFSDEVLVYSGDDGSSLGAFVSSGLDEPDGITFGPDGNLYVANRGSGEIHRFDGLTGVRDPAFLANGPTGYTDIVFGPDGHLWATNQSSDNIERYDGATGADLGEWTQIGATDFAGLAFGPDGYLYMSDAMTPADKIVRYRIADGGSTVEDFIVSGAEGLDQAVNIVFTPAQQVRVTSPPSANPDTATVDEGASVTIDVAANDTDLEHALDLASIVITSGPSRGSIVVNANGTVTYTHDGSETTADSFSYTIDDASGVTSNAAAVAITVTPQNDAPTANPDAATVDEGASITIDLAGDDVDPEGALDLTSIVITAGPTRGSIVVNANGTVTYTHDGSETTADTFSYTIDDASGVTSNAAAVAITVTPQNDAPTANPDAATVDEGASITIDLAGDDVDPEGALDLTSIVITAGPSRGSIVVNANGTVTYTHDGSETTADTFSYTIDDASGVTSNAAAVAITVTPQNDAPTANPDAATVDEGASITIDLAGDDVDPEGALDLTSIVITAGPTRGSIVVNANGTVTYTHDGSETTADSFSYTIDDASGVTSNAAAVAITVTPQNDAPTANPDAATVDEGASITIDLAGDDVDPEGALDLTSIVITAGPSRGSIVVNANGTVTYTHDGSETTADTFSYTIDDASGVTSNAAAVAITVTPQNDAPTANPDAATVDEGASITIDLAGDDVDPEGALDLSSIAITAGPSRGSIVVNANGTVTYTHDGSETTADTFSYTIDDASGVTSNAAAVAITVTPQNDAPTANPDAAMVDEGASITIDLAGDDVDPEGALDLSSIVITSGPSRGSIVVNANGTVTYTHDGSETTADSFSYTIDDASGVTSNAAAVAITVTPQNDAPTANPDAATVDEGASITIDLAGDDVDPEGALDLTSIVITAGPSRGSIVVNANGTVTYTHDGSETTADTFSYTIDDASGVTSNAAAVAITVTPQNDAPTANPDAATVDEGASITIDLAGDDVDPEGALDLTSIVITSGPSRGSIVVNANGTVTYTHDGSETTADTFSYTIDDASGVTSNAAAVAITVTPQNDAPTANPDSATVDEGAAVTINLVGNDTDPDDTLDLGSIVITSGPANGTLVDNGNGTVTYTHNGTETTSDTFSYTIDDASGVTSNAAAVAITVTPQNDAPTANPDAAMVDEGASITIDLAGDDVDPEGALDLSSIVITSGPSRGSIVVNANGTVTYTHDGSETTADSFSYTIDDASGVTSNAAAVAITVTPQNDAPTANPDAATVDEGASITIDLAGDDVDPEGALDLTSIVITAGPSRGSIVVNANGTVTYTHDGSETTADTFSYTIDDASGVTSNAAAVAITVTPQNDAPTANPDAATVDEGASITIDLAGDDVDPEGALDLSSIAITAGPSRGSIVVNANGTVTYTHDGSETTADTFSYTIDDASGVTSNAAAVAITVTPQNDAPTANPDAAMVDEGASITIDLAGDDVDPEGALDLSSIVITSGPSRGSIVVNANGTVTYTHDGSETTADSFSYTIDDASGVTSNAAAVAITVTPQNDAPTANPDAATVDEGASITIDLAGDDVDPEGALDLTSIVITAGPSRGSIVVNANGTVTYTHDGSETTADTFSYTIRDAAGDVSNAAVVSITVTPQNDAPTLSAFGPTLPSINEDAVTNVGADIATIVGSSIGDGDAAALEGIAVTRISTGNGIWQYSTNGGTSWSNIGAVADTNALLLRDADRIRFVPDARNGTTASIDYRAWDRTAGVVATKMGTGVGGGASAFSANFDTALVNVASVNDAPGLASATLAAVEEGATDPSGATVAALFAGRFSDVDTGASLGGVAVVGNGAPTPEGTWQYSTDGGSSWSAVGTVNDGASALALAPSAQLRFVPAAGFSGAAVGLDVRALDDTYGGGFSTNPAGVETRIFVNTSSSGGTSAIGGGIASLATSVSIGGGEAAGTSGEVLTASDSVEPTVDDLAEQVDGAETPSTPGVEPAPDSESVAGTVSDAAETLPPVSLGLIAPLDEGAPVEWPLLDDVAAAPIPSASTSSIPSAIEPSEPRRDPEPEAPLQGSFAGLESLFTGFADDLAFLGSETGFLQELDRLRQIALDEVVLERTAVGSSVAMTAGLSIGYVVWLTRGGLLIASLASSIPVWRLVDPIPVLASLALRNHEDEDDDESLDSMVRDGNGNDEDPAELEAS